MKFTVIKQSDGELLPKGLRQLLKLQMNNLVSLNTLFWVLLFSNVEPTVLKMLMTAFRHIFCDSQSIKIPPPFNPTRSVFILFVVAAVLIFACITFPLCLFVLIAKHSLNLVVDMCSTNNIPLWAGNRVWLQFTYKSILLKVQTVGLIKAALYCIWSTSKYEDDITDLCFLVWPVHVVRLYLCYKTRFMNVPHNALNSPLIESNFATELALDCQYLHHKNRVSV